MSWGGICRLGVALSGELTTVVAVDRAISLMLGIDWQLVK